MLNTKDTHENADKLAAKQVKKAEYIRHPYTKRRLRVLDAFTPNDFALTQISDGVTILLKPVGQVEIPVSSELIHCPACTSPKIEKLLIVEQEHPEGRPYQVLCCGSCTQQSWFVIIS